MMIWPQEIEKKYIVLSKDCLPSDGFLWALIGGEYIPVMLKPAKRKKKISKRVRQLVYTRDKFTCVTCGSKDDLSIDHIIPEAKGGSHHESNFQTLCRPCNSRKGTR